MHRVVALLGALVLAAMHVVPWHEPSDAVFLGWIPDELLGRLVWMGLAWLYLLHFCRYVWVDRES